MKWANFFHIYQPAEQQPDILKLVVDQSYRPVISHIANTPGIRVTLNITGSLLELFDKYGYKDLIDMLKKAGDEGKIEFTGSAKYHAFMPLIDEEDIRRQIQINNEVCSFYLGSAYKPRGFFPPEMGWKKEMAKIIESFGFEWVIIDEISATGEVGTVDYNKIYKIKDSKLKAFFRERRLSNLIMSATVRSTETLKEAMVKDLTSSRYVVTAMDGEIFGHHKPGLEKLLFDIFETKDFNLVTISDLLGDKREEIEVETVASTWASSKNDITGGVQFLSWSDPSNPIHTWQWELFYLVRGQVVGMDKKDPVFPKVQKSMDIATASDHFWWASAKPWWSVEMIEDGAYRLVETVRMIPNVKKEIVDQASGLYEKIISTAFNWQRTGHIRALYAKQEALVRIPFKDKTVGEGGEEAGVYDAFMSMMRGLEKKAADREEYEKAILWRDAMYKLEQRADIYDTVNVIELVKVEIPNAEIEKTIEEYKAKYRAIRGGQPEQRGS